MMWFKETVELTEELANQAKVTFLFKKKLRFY